MRRLRAEAAALVLAVACIDATCSFAVDCGDVLVGPAAFTLDADLACPTGPAITLRDHAVLRMQNHTVRVDAVTTVGIVVEGTGVRLLDGTIASSSVSGALLRVDGTRHLIRNVHTTGHAQGTARGIWTLPTSRQLKITRSSAEFTWDGLSPVGTAFDLAGEEHRLVGNLASHAFTGFRLDGFRHHFVRNQAIGVVLGVDVHGAGHLVARTLVTLSGDAIFVAGDGHRILRNRVENNVSGILTLGSNTLFRRNVALGNFPDLRDDNIDCGTNIWTRNRFETVEVFGDCIE
jgi:hypothetical protein